MNPDDLERGIALTDEARYDEAIVAFERASQIPETAYRASLELANIACRNHRYAECVAHRTVKVFKKTSSGPQLVGKTTSAKQGGWNLSLMAHSGKYFAKTPRQTIMSIDCGGARSETIDVM